MGKSIKEVMPVLTTKTSLLSHVPLPKTNKKNCSTNKKNNKYHSKSELDSELYTRYLVNTPVQIKSSNKKEIFHGEALELSDSTLIMSLPKQTEKSLKRNQKVTLQFKIPEGQMKEGYENTVKIEATIKKLKKDYPSDTLILHFEFTALLKDYFKKRIWKFNRLLATFFITCVALMIIYMRWDSYIYLNLDPFFYGYSLLTAIYLLTRYLFGWLYKPCPINPSYTPGVSIIIPCFNEENYINKTIVSCLNQNYPINKLEVIVVDDFSTDQSRHNIKKTITELKSNYPMYQIEQRLKFIPLTSNSGKRKALIEGVKIATHELVTFVDSDSFLNPSAILNLVQPFQDPLVGGVTGRTDVKNAYTNYLTKMQAVRYFISFRIIKAAESLFDAVTCLSGPLSCYRKSLITAHTDDWLNQRFLGHSATFGDDRSMTNFILKNHRTVYQDSAICETIVPSDFNIFLKQQMRWKRSWLRETLIAGSFMWKKEPFQALSFYASFTIPLIAPIIVIYNLIYVPIIYHIFPLIFIIGLALMSFLMSFTYLLLRKSTLWAYGIIFCLFYEFILLWQMPIACVTFWKSTWGTRDTKEDLANLLKKQKKQHMGYLPGALPIKLQ